MKPAVDQFAETLAAAGVKRIYGIVGDSLGSLTDALCRQGKIEWVHVRHEEVAAFAARAEAHLTGELAVCAGSCGPGDPHLINGLFDCHRSRVPVLAIAAQIPSAEISSGYFQETHPQTLSPECSHYCELVSGANQMPRVLEVAMRGAVGKRGASVVVMPGDVALHTAFEAQIPNVSGRLPARPTSPTARTCVTSRPASGFPRAPAMVVFMNEADMRARGIAEGDLVELESLAYDKHRIVGGFWVKAHRIAPGSIGAYYLETNPLLPLAFHDLKSGTPAAKSIPVLVRLQAP
jgi:hypothetical protein